MKIFSIVLLLICVLMLVQTFNFPALNITGMGPEVFPRIVLVITIILGLMLLYQSFKDDDKVKVTMNKKQLLVLLSIVLYVILLKPLGFIVSSSIFMVLCMFAIKPIKDVKWLAKVLTTTVAVVAGVYFIFAVQLKLFLP